MNQAEVDAIMEARLGGLLSEAGITEYEIPTAWGVREAGGSTASPVAATDAEIAAVTIDFLLDLTEYRLVRDIIGNLAVVDVTAGPRKEALGQLTKFALEYKENLEEKLADIHGWGAPELETAKLTHAFAQHLTT